MIGHLVIHYTLHYRNRKTKRNQKENKTKQSKRWRVHYLNSRFSSALQYFSSASSPGPNPNRTEANRTERLEGLPAQSSAARTSGFSSADRHSKRNATSSRTKFLTAAASRRGASHRFGYYSNLCTHSASLLLLLFCPTSAAQHTFPIFAYVLHSTPVVRSSFCLFILSSVHSVYYILCCLLYSVVNSESEPNRSKKKHV